MPAEQVHAHRQEMSRLDASVAADGLAWCQSRRGRPQTRMTAVEWVEAGDEKQEQDERDGRVEVNDEWEEVKWVAMQ